MVTVEVLRLLHRNSDVAHLWRRILVGGVFLEERQDVALDETPQLRQVNTVTSQL